MLNAYIDKEDVLRLLYETEDINGLINRSDFQKKIGNLKAKKKPKLEKGCNVRIKNRQKLIDSISNYINDVKAGKEKHEIRSYIETHAGVKIGRRSCCIIKVDKETKKEIAKLDMDSFIVERDFIMKILKISKPTLLRFIEICIITQHVEYVNVYASGILKKEKMCLFYYDLGEIKNNLLNIE